MRKTVQIGGPADAQRLIENVSVYAVVTMKQSRERLMKQVRPYKQFTQQQSWLVAPLVYLPSTNAQMNEDMVKNPIASRATDSENLVAQPTYT